MILAATLLCTGSVWAQDVTRDMLVGSWEADFVRMLDEQDMEEDERVLATAMLAGASMVLTFGADGSLRMDGSMMGQVRSDVGTWVPVSIDGRVLTISALVDDGTTDPEAEWLYITFEDANTILMADDNEESLPFRRMVAPVAQATALPATVIATITQADGWDTEACPSSSFDAAEFEALDVNQDGAADYVVADPCNFGANDGDHTLYLAEGGAYRSVLAHYGEALTLEPTVTNGFREMRGVHCDGHSDCTELYYRWNGTAYEAYRRVRDERLLE